MTRLKWWLWRLLVRAEARRILRRVNELQRRINEVQRQVDESQQPRP